MLKFSTHVDNSFLYNRKIYTLVIDEIRNIFTDKVLYKADIGDTKGGDFLPEFWGTQ